MWLHMAVPDSNSLMYQQMMFIKNLVPIMNASLLIMIQYHQGY